MRVKENISLRICHPIYGHKGGVRTKGHSSPKNKTANPEKRMQRIR